MWRPVPSETVLTSVLQHNGLEHLFRDVAAKRMLPGAAFNPALLRLPEGIAASWHPEAYYVAVLRHDTAKVCSRDTEGGFEWTGSLYSSVLLLNKNLETLVVGKLPMPLQDYRLFSFKGKVLVTGIFMDHNHTNGEVWHTRVFELGLNFMGQTSNKIHQCPRLLNVIMHEFKHHGESDFDHKTSFPRFYGKNLGFVGNKDGELQIVWRLSNPVAMKNWTSEGSFHTDHGSKALRKNGSPIYLPEYDAYLTFGHTYWTRVTDLNNKQHNVKNYIHRIVLFEANPPYKWLRASIPFCFPAISQKWPRGRFRSVQVLIQRPK